jgi:Uma2 family endonuclease
MGPYPRLILDLYEAARVPEYLVVLPVEHEIRWYVLVGDKYQLMAPDADGVWRSRVFPGLWLDGKSLLAGNMPQVFATLQNGLNSSEHQTFVAELERRRKR